MLSNWINYGTLIFQLGLIVFGAIIGSVVWIFTSWEAVLIGAILFPMLFELLGYLGFWGWFYKNFIS